jgi:plasmid maintenance system antidote protein VapI
MATANIAFANLRAEMARRNINVCDIAGAIHVARSTAGYKLARKQPITIDEAFTIADNLFPEHDIRYLFAEAAQKD